MHTLHLLLQKTTHDQRARGSGRRPWTLLVATLLLALLCACIRTPTATPSPESLVIMGSTAMSPLLELLAASFMARHPSIAVIVEASNSTQGLAQAVEGRAALGALSAPPPPGTWAVPIAIDGIAIIVHADNPLQNVTLAQLRDLYSGRVWQWSELGVAQAEDEITVISREAGSGTRLAFEALVMAPGRGATGCPAPQVAHPAQRQAQASPSPPPGCAPEAVTSMAVVMLSSSAVVDYVGAHPGAIGYVSRAYLGMQEGSGHLKALRIEDVPAGLGAIGDGSYRLSRPFYLVALQEPTGSPRLLVDFCLSPEGQALVARQHVAVRGTRSP